MSRTLDYYNEHAMEFAKDTSDIEFSSIQNEFLAQLEENSSILDFGCGSGRDSKYFLNMGYRVTALDGSEEICRIAEKNIGIPVMQMDFREFNEKNKYDGIWACASVLHLDKDELKTVLRKMEAALHANGIIYMSFKYGDFSGVRGGRFFTDFNETSFEAFVSHIPSLEIRKIWISEDARPGRHDEKWLNIIMRTVRR